MSGMRLRCAIEQVRSLGMVQHPAYYEVLTGGFGPLLMDSLEGLTKTPPQALNALAQDLLVRGPQRISYS